ncbi:hypothetical protein EVJ50_07325 [Synechococcus sp. RSCCF101]|uniref:HdeD family acid-resistance protein n=1 Tax=Synechococcus sp. RSCCF101 TaxID=2511069 RepID=UPI0012473F8D|nr:DUF308 domain-containing protein [Synechococcus sp. RSCCF101]QEY32073.1 hypothetical protein EVJ50_07325 [Synechococcus sp. RSCCF101]
MNALSPTSATALRAAATAEGVLMIVLGVLALVFPVLASFWVTAAIAMLFLIGGIVAWITTLTRARGMDRWSCFWKLVVATLFLVAGGSMISGFRDPAQATQQVAALSLAIGIVFLVEGALALATGLRHARRPGAGWGIANGVVTLILGILILSMKFWGLLWVLGTLVGISFIFSGIDLVAFSAALHGADPEKPAGESGEPA